MGQAKRRGTFEQRKAESIIKYEAEAVAWKQRQAEIKANRPKEKRKNTTYPLAMAMMMADAFEYRNVNYCFDYTNVYR